MKYKNFEDLPVWRDAIKLTENSFKLTLNAAFKGKGDIANQLQRASLSVANNIAEGFERGSTADLLKFIYIAKGSSGEVRSMCYVLDRLDFLNHLKSEISDLRSEALSISKQLGAWAFSLQESPIQGPRHLSESSKKHYKQNTNASEILDKLRAENEKRVKNLKNKPA